MGVDGGSLAKNHNPNPMQYENVKVWAAQGKHFPASDALIKDFEYEQKSKYEALNLIWFSGSDGHVLAGGNMPI